MATKEFWANVYEGVEGATGMASVAHAGQHHDSREDADFYGRDMKGRLQDDLICRVHVRPKPDGAPARYRNDIERWYWEHYPNDMRRPRSGRAYAT